MRIIDWSSDVCSSDLSQGSSRRIAASMDCPVDPLKIMHGSRRNPSDRWLPSGDFYRYARATALRKPLRPKDGAGAAKPRLRANPPRSEEHTSELQSLMRISYAVFCLKKKNQHTKQKTNT